VCLFDSKVASSAGRFARGASGWLASSLWSSFVARFTLVQRALDVCDGIELRTRLFELLTQPRVFVHFGLQTAVGGGELFTVGADGIILQPAVFRLHRQNVVNLLQLDERQGPLPRKQHLG